MLFLEDLRDWIAEFIWYPLVDLFTGKRPVRGKLLITEGMILMVAVPFFLHFAFHASIGKMVLGAFSGVALMILCQLPYIGPIVVAVLSGLLTEVAYDLCRRSLFPIIENASGVNMNATWIRIVFYILVFLIFFRLHIGRDE